MERFITDSPQDNNAMQMNYAYAKDSQVVLRYAGGEYDIPLTEYIAKCAKNDHGCKGVTPESVMRGDSCSECDCALAILNVVSIQAAELRGRLKAYEDTGLQPEEIIGLCEMDKRAKMADLLRLEEYQSLGDIALLRQLSEADRDGRCVVLPELEQKIGDPLEPLKVFYALSSEVHKYEYREANKPEDISILDYTIIAALKDVLTRSDAEAALGKEQK